VFFLGDFITDINYQGGGGGSGSSPSNMLFCIQDLTGQVSAASDFTVRANFTNLLTNTSWQVVRGSVGKNCDFVLVFFENIELNF
jgi:hypothetical protein